MRQVVDSLPLTGGIIGSGGKLSWPAPTRPGDILSVAVEVLAVTPSRSRPDRGTADCRILTTNQQGDVVQSFEVKLLLARRPSAT